MRSQNFQGIQQIPIILVHGFLDRPSIFGSMASYLRKQGYIVLGNLQLLPNTGKYGIAQLSLQLKQYIELHTGPDQPINIIGFSMGGLVARYYLQNLDGYQKCVKLITIATPHHGTYMAYLFDYKACREMRPGSMFLNELNSTLHLIENVLVTSIWARWDTTIIPNRSSRLPIGQEIVLPFGIHPLLPYHKMLYSTITALMYS